AVFLSAVFGIALPASLGAQTRAPALQSPDAVLANPRVKAALDSIRAWQAWTLEQQIQLTEIEAPPFKEQKRGEEYVRRLRALGYQNVRVDAEGNVIAERPGAVAGPVVILSGH